MYDYECYKCVTTLQTMCDNIKNNQVILIHVHILISNEFLQHA